MADEKKKPTHKLARRRGRPKKGRTEKIAVKDENGNIQEVDKIEAFMEELIKNGGNATQAAIAIGGFTNIRSATTTGSRWLAEAKRRGLFRVLIEKRGYDLGKMVDVALEKMEKSKKAEWWDRMMKMAGYEDFMTKNSGTAPGVAINVFQAHKELTADYIDGEVVEENPLDPKNEN